MKNGYTFLLLGLLVTVLPSCKDRKKKAEQKPKKELAQLIDVKQDAQNTLDIPLATDSAVVNADDSIRSFFDQDVDEFITMAQEEPAKMVPTEQTGAVAQNDEFKWVDAEQKEDFKTVYFDFDRYTIRPDQENAVAYDVDQAKKTTEEQTTVVIEGHACHSAGSAVYNLALSEKRAKVVADKLVESGVTREKVKVVGRGKEVPAIVNGKPVSGSREEQWLNRRVEVRVIN